MAFAPLLRLPYGVQLHRPPANSAVSPRPLTGIYQHVGSHHLKRYVGEFDFRYNHRHINDLERTQVALKGIDGKRLTYGTVN